MSQIISVRQAHTKPKGGDLTAKCRADQTKTNVRGSTRNKQKVILEKNQSDCSRNQSSQSISKRTKPKLNNAKSSLVPSSRIVRKVQIMIANFCFLTFQNSLRKFVPVLHLLLIVALASPMIYVAFFTLISNGTFLFVSFFVRRIRKKTRNLSGRLNHLSTFPFANSSGVAAFYMIF